jgi:hypothetical protein
MASIKGRALQDHPQRAKIHYQIGRKPTDLAGTAAPAAPRSNTEPWPPPTFDEKLFPNRLVFSSRIQRPKPYAPAWRMYNAHDDALDEAYTLSHTLVPWAGPLAAEPAPRPVPLPAPQLVSAPAPVPPLPRAVPPPQAQLLAAPSSLLSAGPAPRPVMAHRSAPTLVTLSFEETTEDESDLNVVAESPSRPSTANLTRPSTANEAFTPAGRAKRLDLVEEGS